MILDPFTRRTDGRRFTLEQLEEAWQWVQADKQRNELGLCYVAFPDNMTTLKATLN
jgi:hypothetical protein